jgi:hypothetical protein
MARVARPTRERPSILSIAFSSLFGQDPVHRRPAHAEGVGDRARRLTISVHPLRQSSLLLVKRLGSSDVLAACPTRFPRRTTPFAAQLQLQLGQTRKYACDHPTRCVRRIDAFPQRPKDDTPLTQIPNRGHHLSGVATQPIYANDNDCVTGSGVVKQRGKTRPLLSCRRARQLVAVDPLRVDARTRERVKLLV